ncbi:hypothetical protein ES703_56030 [subsurface metagenome]
MAIEELCPLIKEDCIRNKCALYHDGNCAITVIAIELKLIRELRFP